MHIKMKPISISVIVTLMTLNTVLLQAADLEGLHVCSKTQEIPVTIKVSYPVPYEVKTFVWCARIPPRCPKIRTAMKTGYRDETKLTNQTIKVCCEGFAELQGRCLPQEVHYHIGNTTTLRIVKEVTPTEEPGSDAGLWAGICMVLLLVVAAFLFLLMRYKKKLHRVKEELQYVSYTVERTAERFDNPLYAQSASGLSPSSDYSSTNDFNDLGGTKINNLEKGFTDKFNTSGKIPCLNYPDEFEPTGAASSVLPSSVLPSSALPSSALPSSVLASRSLPKQPLSGFNPNIGTDLSGKEPIYEDIEKYAKSEEDESVYDEPRTDPRPVVTPSLLNDHSSEIYNQSIASSISANEEVTMNDISRNGEVTMNDFSRNGEVTMNDVSRNGESSKSGIHLKK